MDWTRTKKMMLRWSLLTAGLIALFWAVHSLFTDQMPIVTAIKVFHAWKLSLPFTMSRFWDILLGPIHSIAFFLLLAVSNKMDKTGLGIESPLLVIIMIFGLGIGLATGSLSIPGIGIILVLGVSLFLYLIALGEAKGLGNMSFGLWAITDLLQEIAYPNSTPQQDRQDSGPNIEWLAMGPSLTLGFSLGTGLCFGLAASLAVGLLAILVNGLVVGLMYLASTRCWAATKEWLVAR